MKKPLIIEVIIFLFLLVYAISVSGVLVMDIQQITSDPALQGDPYIYGDIIAYNDTRNGNYDIYIYNLSSGQERQITTNTEKQRGPAIYENIIVWEDNRSPTNCTLWNLGCNSDIYTYNLSNGQETRITNNTARIKAMQLFMAI